MGKKDRPVFDLFKTPCVLKIFDERNIFSKKYRQHFFRNGIDHFPMFRKVCGFFYM